MKFLFVAVLLISTAFAYPLGESDESKSSASASSPNSLSIAKSEESDEKPDHQPHHHHDHNSDVSHENHKEVQSDSNSEESSESNESKPKELSGQNEEEKPQELEAVNKPEEQKLNDEEQKEEKHQAEASEVNEKEEKLKAEELAPVVDEKLASAEEDAPASKSLLEEKIDIVEAANQPAAIAEESAPLPIGEEKSVVKALPEAVPAVNLAPALQEKSIPEGIDLVEKDNSLLVEDKVEPKPEIKIAEEPKLELVEEKAPAESSLKSENDAPAVDSVALLESNLKDEVLAAKEEPKEEKPLELPSAKPEEALKAIPAPQAEASSSS